MICLKWITDGVEYSSYFLGNMQLIYGKNLKSNLKALRELSFETS